MKIQIHSLSPTKDKNIENIEAEYLKRLQRYLKIEIIEGKKPAQKQSNLFLAILCESGVQFDSKKFAGFIEKRMVQGTSILQFAIGDAFGWDNAAKKKADMVISLSSLTFPYQLSRLILIEQLYRAFSIINNGPYHKE
jgi:23S rRNA (pseudouridine1915-N3)-methyltransferase